MTQEELDCIETLQVTLELLGYTTSYRTTKIRSYQKQLVIEKNKKHLYTLYIKSNLTNNSRIYNCATEKIEKFNTIKELCEYTIKHIGDLQ